MTYPTDPLNGPNRRPDILRKRDDSMSGGLLGGIAIAIVLIVGVAIYAMSSGSRDVAGSDAPRIERTAPSTTGQGGANTMPGRDQNIPNPAPPLAPIIKQPK